MIAGNQLGDLHGLSPEMIGGNQMIQQSDLKGLFCLDHSRSKQQFLGFGPANLVGLCPGAIYTAIGCGKEAELGVFTSNPYV